MPASPTATPEHIRDVNERYHDLAAGDYDAKWGIDFGRLGRRQTRSKLRKALGEWPARPFEHALEVGSGTGYFSLNLMQEGAIRRLTATDISGGMLATLESTAAELGLEVATAQTDAESLPFPDASFDLVLGHAVLHHIPDLERALREFRRVLCPGGSIAFCGEPSRNGDRLAALPKRVGVVSAPAWRRLLGAGERAANGAGPGEPDDHHLEHEVDVHAFDATEVSGLLRDAGFEAVRVRGEELVANAYGWLLRTLESTARPEEVPERWRLFAFRSYLALQRIDTALLEPRLPPQLFYNLVLSARRPG